MRKDPSEAGSGGPGDQGRGHAAEECRVAAGCRKEAIWGSGNFAGARIMPARKLGGQLCTQLSAVCGGEEPWGRAG